MRPRKERGDGGVVVGGVGEGGAGEAAARRHAERALVCLELVGDGVVVGRVDDGRDEGEVLGRGAEHPRPADVDVLGRERVVHVAPPATASRNG